MASSTWENWRTLPRYASIQIIISLDTSGPKIVENIEFSQKGLVDTREYLLEISARGYYPRVRVNQASILTQISEDHQFLALLN